MKIKLLVLTLTALLVAGCQVYKQDIQQGNEITADMINQIKRGMTQREVVRILGIPLINDPFHKDRWDYYYSKLNGESGQIARRFATLIFKEGKLLEIRQNISNP